MEGFLMLFPKPNLFSCGLIAITGKKSRKGTPVIPTMLGKEGCTCLERADVALSSPHFVTRLLHRKYSAFWLTGAECLHHTEVPEPALSRLVCLDRAASHWRVSSGHTALQPGTVPEAINLAL